MSVSASRRLCAAAATTSSASRAPTPGAARLARHEIHAVQGTLQDPGTWKGAEDCSTLVHAAVDYSTDTFALDRAAVHSLLSLAGRGAGVKTVVYTSGVWVYGSTGDTLVDETSPLAPLPMSVPRVETEKAVLTTHGVKGLVLRPGCVYGYGGGMTAAWFAGGGRPGSSRSSGTAPTAGRPSTRTTSRTPTCAPIESGLAGEVFNVTDRSRAPLRRLVLAAARAAGFGGRGPLDPRRGREEDDGRPRLRARVRPARGLPQGRRAPRLAAHARRLRGRGRDVLRVVEGLAGMTATLAQPNRAR